MSPILDPLGQQCIDKATVAAVAKMRGLPLDQLNWCEDSQRRADRFPSPAAFDRLGRCEPTRRRHGRCRRADAATPSVPSRPRSTASAGRPIAKLDIVVVDDESTDGSVALVDQKIRQDRRVRLVRQNNAGVAAARNAGAAATAATFLAFIDADDLWAPTKIEFQLDAIRQGGPAVGLAYCWFASIDQRDRVVSFGPQPLCRGRCDEEPVRGNWIGNGSSLLMRRAAFEKAGGYDPTLWARGAQGAEDLLIVLSRRRALRLCRRAALPRGLSRHARQHVEDSLQMFRSTELVLGRIPREVPRARRRASPSICRPPANGSPIVPLRPVAARDARILLTEALRHHPLSSAWHFSGLAVEHRPRPPAATPRPAARRFRSTPKTIW